MTGAEAAQALPRFEGLVLTTARQLVAGGIEMEEEDVAQILRVKVWRALQSFDETRAIRGARLRYARDHRGRSRLERWVFFCMANTAKDLRRRRRHYDASLNAMRERTPTDKGRSDRFDARYLTDHQVPEHADLGVELTALEHQALSLRAEGYLMREIGPRLGITNAERLLVFQSLREKLAEAA